jgi:plasmid replication initiation protein
LESSDKSGPKVAALTILFFQTNHAMPKGMGRMIEGGIKEHQNLERFIASSADIAPKDQIDLMARCWFSLTPGRTEAIQHEYVDARSGQTETVRITGSGEHGIATIHDQDLLIYAISQWIEAKRKGLEPSRRIHFTPYQFLAWMNREPGGGQYQRLKDALHRLKMTSIQTTIRSEQGKRSRKRIRQFSWISEWEITEEKGEIRGIEVVLAEWLFESIQDFHVLTLDKRYFDISGSVERWLYLYARKATGGPTGVWKETFKSLLPPIGHNLRRGGRSSDLKLLQRVIFLRRHLNDHAACGGCSNLFHFLGERSSSGTGGAAVSMNEVCIFKLRWASIRQQAPLPLSSSTIVSPWCWCSAPPPSSR